MFEFSACPFPKKIDVHGFVPSTPLQSRLVSERACLPPAYPSSRCPLVEYDNAGGRVFLFEMEQALWFVSFEASCSQARAREAPD